MPTADGRFKGISVPELPWERRARELREAGAPVEEARAVRPKNGHATTRDTWELAAIDARRREDRARE